MDQSNGIWRRRSNSGRISRRSVKQLALTHKMSRHRERDAALERLVEEVVGMLKTRMTLTDTRERVWREGCPAGSLARKRCVNKRGACIRGTGVEKGQTAATKRRIFSMQKCKGKIATTEQAELSSETILLSSLLSGRVTNVARPTRRLGPDWH